MKRKLLKPFAISMMALMGWQVLFPTVSYAVTGGPSQPEVQGFEPIGTSDMVDLFTGDFHYNIPLMDVGGYPINISYNAGPGMDEEASWVGLGWNLNVGSINRNLRGLPDEFNGDEVVSEYHTQPNKTFEIAGGPIFELFGLKNDKSHSDPFTGVLNTQLGITYNTYRGWGFDLGANLGLMIGSKSGPLDLCLGAGIDINSQDGTTVTPSFSTGCQIASNEKLKDLGANLGLSAPINARSGLRQLNVNAGISGKMLNNSTKIRAIRAGTSTFGLGAFTIDFANPTYIPSIEHPTNSNGLNALVQIGSEASGAFGGVKLNASYFEEKIADEQISSPGYGYFNLDQSAGIDNAMLDFNREKAGFFTPNTPHLGIGNLTQDQFTVSGQGAGGMFRARRGDAGVLTDPHRYNASTNVMPGVDIGGGNVVKGGVNISADITESQSGRLADGIHSDHSLNFVSVTSDKKYEPYYFQMEGEKKAADGDFFGDLHNSNAAYVPLSGEKFDVEPAVASLTSYGTTAPLSASTHRSRRDTRNQQVSFLNGDEATKLGLDKQIKNYDLDGNGLDYTEEERVVAGRRPGHHPSEYTILNPDGGRYVYGIPAYNLEQHDVSFAMGGDELDDECPGYTCENPLIEYFPLSTHAENSLENKKGIDNFYSKQSLPAYAHSYLLTEVLSEDYEDLQLDGPTADDVGTYVKFNYGKLQDDYIWRAPFERNRARHDRGMKSDPNDDRGSYIWGKKEIWYLKSIETRDYVAVFVMSDRDDAVSANGENGDIGGTRMKKLDEIRLYAAKEYEADPSKAPIKTAHFEYSYELCPGVPNQMVTGEGKLTLKKVWFTYYNSPKGTQNKYEFHYDTENPNYHASLIDRWGTYSGPFDCSYTIDGIPYGDTRPDPADWSYTTQSKTDADYLSSAWSISQIDLPSGGIINVEYESDDYAWVQDKSAMQMFQVEGVSKPDATTPDATGYLFRDNEKNEDRTRIYFKLQEAVPDDYDGHRYLAENYFKDMHWLYFRFLVDLERADDDAEHFEHVPGYAEIVNFGMEPASGGVFTRGWVEMKTVPIGDREESDLRVHPVAKAAWQNARLYQPQVVYPGYNTSGLGPIEACKGLLTFWNDLKTLFTSIHRVMREKEHGRDFIPEFSYIRLFNPIQRKMGGGHRVKKITIDDAWNEMEPGQEGFTYGQEYFYSEEVRSDYDGDGVQEVRNVSTGVAQYEPLIGGDENPFRQPIDYVNKNFLAADERYFMEEPLGESMFPGAGVGYSKVTVRNLRHEDVTKHGTGFVVNEFYTAKDFPTLAYHSVLTKERRTSKIGRLLGFGIKDYMTATEGFVVERNDMHGKPKAAWTYAEVPDASSSGGLGLLTTTPLSGTEYFYKEKKMNDGRRRLTNEVETISTENDVNVKEIGVSMDFYVDSRGSIQTLSRPHIGFNIDAISAAAPVVVPSVWPWVPTHKTKFQSVAATKVIDRSGILDKVVAHDRQAKVPTENLLWDEETGEVLLTRTWNEFKEPIYSLALPAHWAYPGMAAAYLNQGLVLKDVDFSAKSIMEFGSGVDPGEYFILGDVVYKTDDSGEIEGPYWVNHIDAGTGQVFLIDQHGYHNLKPYSSAVPKDVKIIRSGHRNMHTAGIMSLALKDNPIAGGSYPKHLDLDGTDIVKEILSSGAVEYSDVWKMQCARSMWHPGLPDDDGGSGGGCGSLYEPFLNEMISMGAWSAGGGVYSLNSPTSYYVTDLYPVIQTYYPSGAPLPTDHQLFKTNSWPYSGAGVMHYQVRSEVIVGIFPYIFCDIWLYLPYTAADFPTIYSFDNLQPKYPGTSSAYYTVEVEYAYADGLLRTETRDISITCPCSGSSGGGGSGGSGVVVGPPVGVKQSCTDEEGDIINPWLNGLRGHWRGLTSYAFLEDRDREPSTPFGAALVGGTEVREAGKLDDYVPFWNYTGGQWLPSGKTDMRWQFTSKVEDFHPTGVEVQSVDPLGNHSAALTGYNESLVTAIGKNTERRNMLFENFEDYVLHTDGICAPYHWNAWHLKPFVTDETAHTGMYSWKATAGGVKRGKVIVDGLDAASCGSASPVASAPVYELQECDCISPFAPQNGNQKYVISAWVKEVHSSGPPRYAYQDAVLLVDLLDASDAILTTVNCRPAGPVIDGWQRIETEITIPSSAVKLQISFKSGSAPTAYLDDLKFAPYDAPMVSYVYHPYNRRLMAELDHNHYATFYEYDEEGGLIRVKKESERGVQTLTESRGNLTKIRE